MSPIRALGLLSGGLDSALAAKLLLDQNIEVIGLHLESPTACRTDARAVAGELGIELHLRSKGEEYLRLLRHPRFGYGRNMNPCIDCRLFMFQLGQPYLEEFGAQFMFTGEVLGQRPMSQTREAMRLIDKNSGLEGWILRPLSARLLPETEPERRGFVDRGRLLAISGRSRIEQLALARRYGLSTYQPPGGGCLLTDPLFARKLKSFFEHTPEEGTTMRDMELLRIGRHFYFETGRRIVLGRDADENRRLLSFEAGGRWLVEPRAFSGPVALVCGPEDERFVDRAIELILRHSRPPTAPLTIRWRWGGEEHLRIIEPATVGAPSPPS